MSDDTKVLIEDALLALFHGKEKINVNRVAAKAGVSNALIYNRYPELVCRINGVKERQKKKQNNIDAICDNEGLKKQIFLLKQKNAKFKEVAEDIKKQNEYLWEHIQQIYRMYDQVLSERNTFAEKLKHHK